VLKRPRILLCFGLLCWAVAISVGSNALLEYDFTSAQAASPPLASPPSATATTAPTLLMFAHPQCPCTRASIEALREILAHKDIAISAQIHFFSPVGATDAWVQAENWQAAAAIPGLSLRRDMDGATAARYQARTSGYCVVYDVAGTLQYAGGLTISRGHRGPSPGADAVLQVARGAVPHRHTAPTVGCTLLNDTGAAL